MQKNIEGGNKGGIAMPSDLEIAELLAEKMSDINVASGDSIRFLKAFTADELMMLRQWISQKRKRETNNG